MLHKAHAQARAVNAASKGVLGCPVVFGKDAVDCKKVAVQKAQSLLWTVEK